MAARSLWVDSTAVSTTPSPGEGGRGTSPPPLHILQEANASYLHVLPQQQAQFL